MRVPVRRRESSGIQTVSIETEYIKLQDFLKFSGAVPTGGAAKTLVQEGAVEVNGETCTMRGKKLRPGDTVRFGAQEWLVAGPEAQAHGA